MSVSRKRRARRCRGAAPHRVALAERGPVPAQELVLRTTRAPARRDSAVPSASRVDDDDLVDEPRVASGATVEHAADRARDLARGRSRTATVLRGLGAPEPSQGRTGRVAAASATRRTSRSIASPRAAPSRAAAGRLTRTPRAGRSGCRAPQPLEGLVLERLARLEAADVP